MIVTLLYNEENHYCPWKIKGHPLMYSKRFSEEDIQLPPETVAHDVIEHVNGWQNIGTVEDELEAIGGAIFTRLSFGGVTDTGLSIDLAHLMECIIHRDLEELVTRKSDYHLEEVIEFMHDYALRSCLSEYNDLSKDETLRIRENLKRSKSWIRSGYRKATKMYKTPHRAYDLFYNMQYALSHHNIDGVFPDIPVTMHYQIKNGMVRLEEEKHYE